VIADALRGVYDYAETVAQAIAPHAARFGLGRGNGFALLEWLLDLTADPERGSWLDQARSSSDSDRAQADGDRTSR
jgi:hypothetical protein